jgi:hypothetical protein
MKQVLREWFDEEEWIDEQGGEGVVVLARGEVRDHSLSRSPHLSGIEKRRREKPQALDK